MSYDLIIWEGQRPSGLDEAEEIVDQLLAEVEAHPQREPTPAIRSLVDELLRRWPDTGDGAPWAVAPVMPSAVGPTLELSMVVDERLDDICAVAASTAARLGLVYYDPQAMEIR